MTSFYDDFCQLEVQELADSAQATAQVVLRLLGWRIAEETQEVHAVRPGLRHVGRELLIDEDSGGHP